MQSALQEFGTMRATIRRRIKTLGTLLSRIVWSRREAQKYPIILDINYRLRTRTLQRILLMFEVLGLLTLIRLRAKKQILHLAGLLRWYPNVRFALWTTLPKEAEYLFTDSQRTSYRTPRKKMVFVYDSGPNYRLEEGHYAVPFTLHPQAYVQYFEHTRLHRYRERARKIRILFAGNSSLGYHNQNITDFCGLLSRYEIVEHLRPTGHIMSGQEDLESVLDRSEQEELVLIDTAKFRVNGRLWLDLLSQAEFFLSLPGISIPLCHNIIEALAVGTIPITNYSRWFYPRLAPDRHCLSFSTLDELDKQIVRAKAMNRMQIATLRTQAVAYYDRYLDLPQFMRRILESPGDTTYLHIDPEAG